MLSEHGVEDFGDHALPRLGELADGLDLLLEARGGAALAGWPGGRLADQHLVQRQLQGLGQDRQKIGVDPGT